MKGFCFLALAVCLLVHNSSPALANKSAGVTPWSGRSLLNAFTSLSGDCPQGPQQENTQETMLNEPSWWESHWGRTGASWPRRGFKECWAKRSNVCALPNQDHVVCLPGSRRGSTINRGWALDPKSQACKPGVHCLYACEPGYYWTAFNQQETSNYDFANAHQKGHCDGTWDYGTSTHGVYCKEDGTLDMPSKPLCALGETYVYAENRLDKHVFLCQTVFPGHEIFLIPTLIKPGETVMITTQPINYWGGPTYGKPPHGDIYVSFAGADIMEACTWDGFSPSGAALLPYEIGTGVEDNGQIYSTHYFYQQPNSEVPANMVGYTMDLECKSSVEGVCGDRVAHNNVITMVTKKKPPPGSTKLKFVFKKPGADNGQTYMYTDPNRNYMPDPMVITGLKSNAGSSGSSGGYKSVPAPGQYTSFDTYSGRKLKSAYETKSFIENTLTEPIVACGTENGIRMPGMSVGPGEIVQLPDEGTFLIGLKGDSWFACSDMTNLPWIIDIDNGHRSGNNRTYSFRPQDSTGLLDQHLLYSILLKCTAEDDDDACTISDPHTVSVAYNDASSPEIVFQIKGIRTSPVNTQLTSAAAYEWGTGLTRLFSSLLRGKGSSSAIVQ